MHDTKECDMTMTPPDCKPLTPRREPADSVLDKLLRVMSLVTMLMTVPQVYTVWFGNGGSGVSPLSWGAYLVSACLWFIYGLRKHDKTIYVACVGWILLDAAIVIGVIVRS
jgi:uncharacterized protein with PQ loop repeat